MAQRLPSIRELVDTGQLSTFETTYVTLSNGQRRIALIMDRGEEEFYYQGGQFVSQDVLDHLASVMATTMMSDVSSAVSTISTQAVSNSMGDVAVQASEQLSYGLFKMGNALEEIMSPKTFESIFKQLNVLGEAVLMSTDESAGRWWVQEHGVRPSQRYTGYLFGKRNVVTGVISGGGKGFEWPDIATLDREVKHWRVIEFGNKNPRPMPKGYIYPYHPKGSKFTDSQFTFKKPKTTSKTGASGTDVPLWTGPLGFGVSDAEEDADAIAERAKRAAGMMVQNRPKHLFATVHQRALIDDKVFGLFNDLSEIVYQKTMRESAKDAEILTLSEIQDKIRARITL